VGTIGFILGLVSAVLVYWFFMRRENSYRWYEALIAALWIAWVVFSLAFVFTSLLEGALQAAAVAALLFGVGAVILLVIVRRLTSLSTGTSSSPGSAAN